MQLRWLRNVFVSYILSHYEEADNLEMPEEKAEWRELRKKLFNVKESDYYGGSYELAMHHDELSQSEFEELWAFFLKQSDPVYIQNEDYSLESKFRAFSYVADNKRPMPPVYILFFEVCALWDGASVGDWDDAADGEQDEDGLEALFMIMREWAGPKISNEDADDFPELPPELEGRTPWDEDEVYMRDFGPKIVGRRDEIQRRRDEYWEKRTAEVKAVREAEKQELKLTLPSNTSRAQQSDARN